MACHEKVILKFKYQGHRHVIEAVLCIFKRVRIIIKEVKKLKKRLHFSMKSNIVFGNYRKRRQLERMSCTATG